MPAIGDPAPTFTLTDDEGAAVSLADVAGRRVVLYFYPKDDTPGCTTQACALRDGWAEVQALDVVLFGISPDLPASHAKFRAKFDLPYPLLADEGHAVAEAYGVWVEKSMYGKKYMGVQRATFIIGPDGRTTRVFPKVQPKKHDDLVLGALAELS
jgi:peroxiredoxin Q/BCP